MPLDLTWGGPYWVDKAPAYTYHWWAFAANTTVGILGLTVTCYLLWRWVGRRWWDRATVLATAVTR